MSLVSMIAAVTAAAVAPPMPAFLAGCWEHRDGERWSQECWTDPRGGQMMGSGRSGTGDRLKNWEWMRIVRAEDGTIAFLGSPGGAAPTAFGARQLTATTAEFANPAHDYPQRIHYALKSGRLEAEVSMLDGSKAERWNYVRSGSSVPAKQKPD